MQITPVFPELSLHPRAALLDPPLYVGLLPDDIHRKIVLSCGVFAAPGATVFITSPLTGRVGVDRHPDTAGQVFGDQLQVVAGL